jgi:hypothetical protein
MADSTAMNPEHGVQQKFSIGWASAALLLFALVMLFDRWEARLSDRQELGPRAARIAAKRVAFVSSGFAPFRFAGAWRLTSDDPRFGGISALAVDDGKLVALSDSGVLVRFNSARDAAQIDELPDGPGDPDYKVNRDSEALAVDSRGRGWWVAFENRDELWLYDRGFERALQSIWLGNRGWKVNNGIEGIATAGQSLLLLHEGGQQLISVTGTRGRTIRIGGAAGKLTDGVEIDGFVLVVERRLTALGFRNALVVLERAGEGFRVGGRFPLPLSPFDNVEAVAAERLPGGGHRLWLMTDDNLLGFLRTLLVALDMPPSGLGEGRSEN